MYVSSKTKGPGKEGAPRNHPEISSRKVADIECRFPGKTHMERTEHHFGPFWEKDFGAISGGPFFFQPLCFLVARAIRNARINHSQLKPLFGGAPKEWGQKSSVCPSKPRKTKLFGRISRDFGGTFGGRPKSLRKKQFVFNLGP